MKYHYLQEQDDEQITKEGRKTMCGAKPIMAGGMATNLTSPAFFSNLTLQQQEKYICSECVEKATAEIEDIPSAE